MSSPTPDAPTMIPTGRDWRPLAVGCAMCTAGVATLVFWMTGRGPYGGMANGSVAPLLLTGFMALLMAFIVAPAWYASKSAVWVDPATQKVLVRRGAGLGTTDWRMDISDVAAVAVELEEYDTPQPRPGPSLLSIAVVVICQLLPRTRTAYALVLRHADGRPPVRVLSYRCRTIAAMLPVATQVAEALGCPLETPDGATPCSSREPPRQLAPLDPRHDRHGRP